MEGSSHHQLVSGCLLDLAHQGDDKLQARSRTAEGQPERSTWDLTLWEIVVSCFFSLQNIFFPPHSKRETITRHTHTHTDRTSCCLIKLPIQEANAVGAVHMVPGQQLGVNPEYENICDITSNRGPFEQQPSLQMAQLKRVDTNDGSLEEMIPNSAVQVCIPSIQGLWSFIGPCVAYFSGTGVV